MQDRLTYANGNTITTEGFRCTVGEAIYDDEVVADENGDAVLSTYGIVGFNMNSQYLVTLEVNGVSKLYRELWTSGNIDDNNAVPMGEYTFSMDDTTIMGLAEGDHVRIKIEPVTVKTTDAFRAAVKSLGGAASESSGGGSGGGGIELVNFNLGDGLNPPVICDHTKAELDAAREAGKVLIGMFNGSMAVLEHAGEDTPEFFPAYNTVIHGISVPNRTIYENIFACDKNGEWSYSEGSMDVPAT